jgi:hypothetical protein
MISTLKHMQSNMLSENKKKTSIFHVTGYFSNWLTINQWQRRKESDGRYRLPLLFNAMSFADLAFPVLAAEEEDTGPLVEALLKASSGKNLLACRGVSSVGGFASRVRQPSYRAIRSQCPASIYPFRRRKSW